MKKFLALFMTFIMLFCFSVSAVAAEPEKVNGELSLVSEETVVSESVSEQAEPRASQGGVIAGGATTIYGGVGSLDVYLSSGNFWADIVAQIDSIDGNRIVSVMAVTPDGDSISLGSMIGSGGRTSSYELFYAPAGTYHFTFTSASSNPYDVSVFIYD